MKYKSIAWSYPSSPNATKAGFGKTGCFSVEVRAGINPPKQVKAFATENEAKAFYASLPHAVCPVYQWAEEKRRKP